MVIEELGHHFVGNIAQSSSRAPAPAPAPGLATPAVTLPRVSSVMEQRRPARLAAAGHGSSSHGAQGGGGGTTCNTPRRPSTGTNYRGQNVEAEVCSFAKWAPQERVDACSGHGRACGVTGSALVSSTHCPPLPRGRSDQLPSAAQLFFAVVFD